MNKIKSAATEVTALKTQTPIVAKPTEIARTIPNFRHASRNLHFYKFIIGMTTKGYTYPIKTKIALAKIFSWFGIVSISHIYTEVKKFRQKILYKFRFFGMTPVWESQVTDLYTPEETYCRGV